MARDSATSSSAQTDGAGGVQSVRVAVVGTGFSGLGTAIRLKQAGIEDFVVLERADDLGGTWRDNHYPGCCCDVPSHLYSYSFELNPLWTRAFAPQWEIWEYLRSTAEKYGVIPHIRYEHELLDAAWDEDSQRWRIETTGGPFDAQVLVLGAGALSNPMIPELPGLETFEGKAFHSATWDHDHDFAGERVAAIGTGASAIQFVPQVAPRVDQLYLFQRTPPWIIPRWDHQITRWEKFLLTRIPFLPAVVRGLIYAALEIRVLGFTHPRLMKTLERVARWHLKRQVPDPQLREKLTPDYTLGCKRILISDNYYPSLTEPNVEVVTDGIEEVTPKGIRSSDGIVREVDTILWGTGFYVTEFPIAPKIHGRGEMTLADKWREGPQAHLGMTIAGFPNLFLMTGPNSGLGHTSMVFMIESQLNYILTCLQQLDATGASAFDVREDVQDAFNNEVQRSLEGTVWTAEHCKSWYLDAHGKNRSLWPTWTFRYRNRTRRFRPGDHRIQEGAATPAGADREVSPRP